MIPTPGELRLAEAIFRTEARPRRRRLNPLWMRLFDGAVVVTFVFFLFM